MMLRYKVAKVLGNGIVLNKPFRGPFAQIDEYRTQLVSLSRADERWRVQPGFSPLVIEGAKLTRKLRRVLNQSLRKDLLKDRQADKWARNLNQLQKLCIFRSSGHQASPFDNTKKVPLEREM